MKIQVGNREAGVWVRLRESLCEPPAAGKAIKAVWLMAHPDDETIAASTILSRLPGSVVTFLTDGAPRDRRFWSPDVSGSREEYADVRRQEAIAALKLVGIPAHRLLCLGAGDQDAVYELPRLIEEFRTVLDWFRPEAVITHAYEGGHPDHDCAALVASVTAGLHQSSDGVELFEIPLYHARGGECRKGEFLPESEFTENSAELRLALTPKEQARKQAMIACYRSQQRVLQGFPLETERLRPAPAYEFTMPPHNGKLWYECLQWPMTGAQWRDLASGALARLHASVCG